MAVQRIREPKVETGKFWSECGKKNRYKDEAEAGRVISNRAGDGGKDSLRYYECRFCDGFHLTKQERR